MTNDSNKDKTIVLIATYKGNQLEKWSGYYNYPISDADTIVEADAKRIEELWLFKGTTAQKNFYAKFIGIKTRDELINKYAYPASGKAHSDKYLLFKITPIEYPSIGDKKVILRSKDFASSKKLQAQLKAYLESDERNTPEIAAKLPEVVTAIPKESLCVCETAFQLSFWDLPEFADLKPKVPFPSPTTPKFKFIDLFAGIGGIRLGFQSVGGVCVFSSEFNEDACATYEANFGEHPFGDITKIDEKSIPDHDILCAGFPCQPFSISGKQKGFDDTRGTLFFDICRILNEKKPSIVFLENVKHLVHHNGGKTLATIIDKLEGLGYTVSWKVLNGSDYGVPQNRERIIIIGALNGKFDFDNLQVVPRVRLLEYLDIEGEFEYLEPEDYTLIDNPKQQPDSGLIFAGYRNKSIRKVGVRPGTEHLSRVHKQPNRIYSVLGIHPTLPSQESSGRYFVLTAHNRVRKLTINECWKIMGFPETYIKISSIGEQYKQLGNSVCVPMIKAIATEIKNQLLGGN